MHTFPCVGSIFLSCQCERDRKRERERQKNNPEEIFTGSIITATKETTGNEFHNGICLSKGNRYILV